MTNVQYTTTNLAETQPTSYLSTVIESTSRLATWSSLSNSLNSNLSSLFNLNNAGNQINKILTEYTGDLSGCLSNCSNNGVCILNSAQKFVCQCHFDKTGSSCQITNRPCGNNPCLNNGTCVERLNDTSFECVCSDSALYYGVFCERKFDLCKNSTVCFNNQGSCYMNGAEPACKCRQDYSGNNCEIISTSLAIKKSFITVASSLAIAIIACFILTVICLDFLKYYVMQNKKSLKKKEAEITQFIYYPLKR